MTGTIGTLYIISAPSGGGKTSLVSALLAAIPNLEVSISYTTRLPRASENNHFNYHFVDETGFIKLVNQHAFLEHARVFGNYYGTPSKWVMDKLQAGIDIILEIDWQGAQQIRQLLPDSLSIFLIPPAWEVIQGRLQKRAQDNPATIAQRMATARKELLHCSEYSHLVVNDQFLTALNDLKTIIHARRLRYLPQQQKYADLLEKLLA